MNTQAQLLLPGFQEEDFEDMEILSLDSPLVYQRSKPVHMGEKCPKFDSQKSFDLKYLLSGIPAVVTQGSVSSDDSVASTDS